MAWWTEKDALNEQIRLLRKEIKAKDEQIAEMQMLIDKANEKLKVHFSDVVSPAEPSDEEIREICWDEYMKCEDPCFKNGFYAAIKYLKAKAGTGGTPV